MEAVAVVAKIWQIRNFRTECFIAILQRRRQDFRVVGVSIRFIFYLRRFGSFNIKTKNEWWAIGNHNTHESFVTFIFQLKIKFQPSATKPDSDDNLDTHHPTQMNAQTAQMKLLKSILVLYSCILQKNLELKWAFLSQVTHSNGFSPVSNLRGYLGTALA